MKCIILCGLLTLAGFSLEAAEKYFFTLAGRDFTKQEALKLAGGRSDLQAAVKENIAAASAIVLCARENIELSAARTRDFLQNSLKLMPPETQKDFQAMLVRENLTRSRWLDREAEKLNNQLSEAVIKWYIKRYGKDSPVTSEHVQNWYYRNMDLFRRVKLDLNKVWVFGRDDAEKMQKALAALRQAVPPESVRKTFALSLSDQEILEELHSGTVSRTNLDHDYRLFTGTKHLFLAAAEAVTYTALPLDDALKNAISNALYEALAKARLAETLKREFNDKKIVFY